MIYYSGHFPPSSGGGVVGTSLVDLTATSFADIFALATDYSSGTVYKKGDVVYNQSALWVYINNTNDSGNPPPTLPAVSNSWWEFIGSRGTFTWIAYGNSIDGGVTITDFTTGVYNSGGIVREFIGMAVNKTAATESTNPADYTWSKFVGKDGNDGNDGSDGIDAITGMLTNESTQLFAYANGSIVSYTPATGYFKIYSGTQDVSANFSLSTQANPQNLTVTYTGGLQYSVTGGFDSNEDTASLTIRATGSGAYSGITIDKVFSLSKAKGGYEIVNELPISNLFIGRVVFLTTDSKLYRYNGTAWTVEVQGSDIVNATITTAKFASSIEPISLVTSVPGSKTTNTVFNTTDGKLYRWNGSAYVATVPTSDLSGTISDAQIAGLAASKVTGQLTDSQLASIAAAKLTGQITGSQIASAAIDTTKFASSIEPISLVTSVPGSKTTSTVFNTTDGKLYRWTGTTYVASVATSDLSGTISDAQISALAASKVTGQLSDSQLAAIAAAKVTGQLSDSQLAGISSSKLVGQLQDSQLAAIAAAKVTGTISSVQIANAAVTADKISAGAVSSTKFASGIEPVSIVTSVPGTKSTNTVFNSTDGKLYRWNGSAYIATTPAADVTGQITTTQISDDAVTTAKIAANAVTANEIASNTITAGQIAADTITSAQIAANAITASEIAAGAITTTKIAAGAVTATELAAGSVTTNKLAAGAVTANEIAAGAITTNKLAANAVTANEIAAGAITTAKIAANAITSNEIAAGTIVAGDIAANAITATQLAAGAVTTNKLSVLSTGSALNPDPGTQDPSAWSGSGITVAADTSSPTGYSITASTNVTIFGFKTVPFDRSKNYIIRSKVKQVSGTSKHYLAVAFYDANNAIVTATGWPGTGTYNYYGLVNQTAPTSWTEYTLSFGPDEVAQIPATAVSFKVGILANYTDSGSVSITDIRVIEKANASLIVDGSIVSAKLATGSVTTGKLAANAVTANEIAAGAITTAKISAGAITATEIASGAVTTAKLSAGAVTANEIAAATITGSKIAANTITGSNIAADTITAGQIAASAITSSEIAAGAITTEKLAAGSITANEIASATITGAKIAANTITAANIAADTITASQIASNAITAAEIAAGAVTTAKLAAGAVTANEIAAATITGSKIAANTITASNIAADTITSGQIAAGAISASELAAGSITSSKLAVGDTSVLDNNPNFEEGDVSWIKETGWTIVSEPSNAYTGSWVAKNTNAGSGAALRNITRVPCTPGETFYAEAYIKHAASTNGGGSYVRVGFYDSSGGQVSLVSGSTVLPTVQTYTLSSVSVTVPSGAVSVDIQVVAFNTSGTTYADNVRMFRSSNSVLIADGAVTANKLTANSVTADKISAGAVTAAKINVTDLSSITANVGTLTAGIIRNTSDSYRVDVTNGRTITQVGTYMKVSGAPFGSSNQFIEWYGPYFSSLSSCTEANAVYYLKTNGQAYFGGSLSAGIIKNSAQSTNTASNASLTVGPFTTNGGTKTIVLSYGYSYSYYCSTNTGSITGTHSISVLLEKSLDGGSTWTTLTTLNPAETERSVFVDGEPGVPDRVIWAAGSTTTITDNTGATNNMTLRARITSRTLPTFGGTSKTNIEELQNISIVSTE